ncbi:MAG: PDZ domain-containing protein [Planctomycetota bacterium]
MRTRFLLGLLALPALGLGCSKLDGKLADTKPPLYDMEEPLALHGEPEDEDARRVLPLGGFTGIYAGESRESLDEMDAGDGGLQVVRVVENSPGAAAGVVRGDLLLEVTRDGKTTELRWVSEWRELELQTEPGTRVQVLLDRAGVEKSVVIEMDARLQPPARHEIERFRDEEHVGVVVRTATEAEARSVGLGAGAGAVIVGLTRSSPWRRAGLRFGDLIFEVDGTEIAHPSVLLDAIRNAENAASLKLRVRRGTEDLEFSVAVSRRAKEVKQISIPILFSYKRDGGFKTTSVLLGAYRSKRTPAAYEHRLLWIFRWRGGDADKLVEVKEPSE